MNFYSSKILVDESLVNSPELFVKELNNVFSSKKLPYVFSLNGLSNDFVDNLVLNITEPVKVERAHSLLGNDLSNLFNTGLSVNSEGIISFSAKDYVSPALKLKALADSNHNLKSSLNNYLREELMFKKVSYKEKRLCDFSTDVLDALSQYNDFDTSLKGYSLYDKVIGEIKIPEELRCDFVYAEHLREKNPCLFNFYRAEKFFGIAYQALKNLESSIKYLPDKVISILPEKFRSYFLVQPNIKAPQLMELISKLDFPVKSYFFNGYYVQCGNKGPHKGVLVIDSKNNILGAIADRDCNMQRVVAGNLTPEEDYCALLKFIKITNNLDFISPVYFLRGALSSVNECDLEGCWFFDYGKSDVIKPVVKNGNLIIESGSGVSSGFSKNRISQFSFNNSFSEVNCVYDLLDILGGPIEPFNVVDFRKLE